MISFLPLIALKIFILSVDCANSRNFQSAFNSFQPQSPNPPKNRLTPQYQAPSQQQQQRHNIRISDGGEINPDFDGNNWSRRSPFINEIRPVANIREWFPTLNGAKYSGLNSVGSDGAELSNSVYNNSYNRPETPREWFPNLSGNSFNNRYSPNNHLKTGYSNRLNRYNSDFQEKISLINSKNYDLSSSSLNRDVKLLSLAYEIISSASSTSRRPLNILHLGTGSGFVPVALAVFSRPIDSVRSLDDSPQSSIAKDNIIKDGKEIFLARLSLNKVTNLVTALIPPAPNNLLYDLIVSSKSIDQYTSIPRSLKDSLVPRGIIIYPEEVTEFNRRIKVDKIDEYGNLQTIKIAEL